MKAFAMLGLDRVGWIEKPRPECGPLDAIVRPTPFRRVRATSTRCLKGRWATGAT